MSAFEITLEAAVDHGQATDVEDGPEVVVQDDEIIVRESDTAWISTTDLVEVRQ